MFEVCTLAFAICRFCASVSVSVRLDKTLFIPPATRQLAQQSKSTAILQQR